MRVPFYCFESRWLGPYAERAIREIEDQINEIMEQRTGIEDELDEFAGYDAG